MGYPKIKDIYTDLYKCELKCSIRGFKRGVSWAAGLTSDLVKGYLTNSNHIDTEELERTAHSQIFDVKKLNCHYRLPKSSLDIGHYDEAAFHSQSYKDNEVLKVIHFYSKYLAAEKHRLDSMADTIITIDARSTRAFSEIRNDMERNLSNPDSWILYVYAIVLLKLDIRQVAIDKLVASIVSDPLNWPSWQQLAVIIDKNQFEEIKPNLPHHWMRHFFEGIVYLELEMNEQAFEMYTGPESFIQSFFYNSNYVKTQIATIKHNLRDVDSAIEVFKEIRASNPYRLDKMDIYSNLLYIGGNRHELASLSHAMNNIDQFRVETCCCIANFYSMRSDHAKAVIYYQRALQLDPAHVSALILMGHEYVELKNTSEAIRAYRAAININQRDYRAWYGLGQTYEILSQPNYCLVYYSRAHNLRPYDTRMIMALGDTYERLQRDLEAIKCYERAGGTGLFKWASLLEKNGRKKEAAEVYKKFIPWWRETNLNQSSAERDSEYAHAVKFLEN